MIYKRARQLLRRYPESNFVASIRDFINRDLCEKSLRSVKRTKNIAAELIPDPVYFALMGSLVGDTLRETDARPQLVVVRSVNAVLGFSVLTEVRRSAIFSWLFMRQWINSYEGLKSLSIAYRSSSLDRMFADFCDAFRSYGIWKRWRQTPSNGKLEELEIDGVTCGDLVIDSYLRLKPSPKFNVNSFFVWRLLWQALRDVGRAKAYFKSTPPALYLTAYATYIEHGIAARVAVSESIPVYSFGNLVQFGLRLTDRHYRHTPDCSKYRESFAELSSQAQKDCLAEAERLLEFRLSGGLDQATSYMKNSAYAKTQLCSEEKSADLKGAVIVFLHDFYDSPHVWDSFIFTDFWDWIVATIETLESENIKYFVKPHPNQVALSDRAIVTLREKYPTMRWLNISTDNRVLAEAGISLGVTVYGTVAHELAYLGVPTLGAASHPHHAFNFCYAARTRNEYISYLKEKNPEILSREQMKEEAMEFFVMHNRLYDPQQREVASAFVKYWKLAAEAKTESESAEALIALQDLRRTAGYNGLIKELSQLVAAYDS